MPIYEYTCASCEASFEHLQRSMTDGPKPPCPECGSKKTAKKLSVFAVTSASPNRTALPQSGGCGHCGGVPGSCMSGQ